MICQNEIQTLPSPNSGNKPENEHVVSMTVTKHDSEKKALTDTTTPRKRISGIYKIVNKVNGKYYVGSSADMLSNRIGRFDRHRNLLKRNCHFNDYLQRSWNKYGEFNFEFVIVEQNIPNDCLLVREQIYLEVANQERDRCYNLNFKAEGNQVREYSRRKMSASLKSYYSKNPDVKKKQTRCCHTVRATQKRTNSLNEYWKNNTLKKVGVSVRIKSYFSNPQIRDSFGKQFRDSTVYRFQNILTSETYVGTQYDFRTKYELKRGSLNNLIKGRNKSYRGWVIV